jgi:predicted esterase YcpF (UPF0227 family)
LKTLIYLHGFNSSPESHKAQLTKRYFEKYCPELRLVIPKLSPEPSKAIVEVDGLIAALGSDALHGFIGSSLGGYYALHLMSKYISGDSSLKTVLINPAVKPYDLLVDYLGENTNYYSGETYTVLPEHMEELRSLDLSESQKRQFVDPKHVFVLTQTLDEVLPYQQALDCLPRAKVWVQSGGDHAFCHYENVLPAIRNFFR